MIPEQIDQVLRSKISVLYRMNKAVKAVCLFVNDAVKVGDDRDSGEDCTPAYASTRVLANAHFLWAFSHPTEALVFQTVLLYTPAGGTISNFEVAAQTVNDSKYQGDQGLVQLVTQVADIKTAVDTVYKSPPFQIGQPMSMMTATLLDFDAANRAYLQISGLPESITEPVSTAMAAITDIGQKVGGGIDGNVEALKGQLAGKLITEVGPKISAVIESKFGKGATVSTIDALPQKTEAEKATYKQEVADLCESYDKISAGGSEEEQASKPAARGLRLIANSKDCLA